MSLLVKEFSKELTFLIITGKLSIRLSTVNMGIDIPSFGEP